MAAAKPYSEQQGLITTVTQEVPQGGCGEGKRQRTVKIWYFVHLCIL